MLRGQETVVITAPTDNTEQKTFLGYDWSNRKGSEGIVLNPNGGYLTNEKNRFAHGTLATFVRNAFSNMRTEMGEESPLVKYAASYRTIDMLDFSKTKFDKAIRTSAVKRLEIISKYPIAQLGELVNILNGYAFKSTSFINSGIRVIRISNVQRGEIIDKQPVFYPNDTNDIEKYLLKEDDILMSLTGEVGRVGLLPKDLLPAALNQRVACLREKETSRILHKYLFHFLNTDKFCEDCNIFANDGLGRNNLSTEWLKLYPLPLPPIYIQQQIIDECQKVDEEYKTSRMSIEDYRKKIAQVFENLQVIESAGGGA